jgi:hypothetical protein
MCQTVEPNVKSSEPSTQRKLRIPEDRKNVVFIEFEIMSGIKTEAGR